MSPGSGAVADVAHGCRVVARSVEGPDAREIFLHAAPPARLSTAGAQAEALYRAVGDVLADAGAALASVVDETVFLRNARADLDAVRGARDRVLDERGAAHARRAMVEIGQPPLDPHAALEVALHAVLPRAVPLPADAVAVAAPPACGCAECARAGGVLVRVGGESQLRTGALYGGGGDAYTQALAMFEVAERLLARAGMEFADVVRTWIWLRDIERDYASLNRARRAFFTSRRVDPPPASTGIGGGPAAAGHDLCLAVYAVRSTSPIARAPMSAPTLNEAPQYGADFARGMRVARANHVALHVSGTASVDERGRTAHPGDFGAQAERMLVNLRALLEGQGAGFGDVVSAVTYVKRPADASDLRARLRAAGFTGFPHALVEAPICRPDLLCETEALAVLDASSQRVCSTSSIR